MNALLLAILISAGQAPAAPGDKLPAVSTPAPVPSVVPQVIPQDLQAAIVAVEADKAAVATATAELDAAKASIVKLEAAVTSGTAALEKDTAAMMEIIANRYHPKPNPPTPTPVPVPVDPKPVDPPKPVVQHTLEIVLSSAKGCGTCDAMEKLFPGVIAAGVKIRRDDTAIWGTEVFPCFVIVFDGKEISRSKPGTLTAPQIIEWWKLWKAWSDRQP